MSSEVFIMIASVFELQSLLNYYAQQTVSRWSSSLIDTPFSAQMNLCYALVASTDSLFDLEISLFALYAAFCRKVEVGHWMRSEVFRRRHCEPLKASGRLKYIHGLCVHTNCSTHLSMSQMPLTALIFNNLWLLLVNIHTRAFHEFIVFL